MESCFEENGVSAEELQSFHGLDVECHDGVVIVHGVVHDETVWRLLSVQYRRAEVFLLSAAAARTHSVTQIAAVSRAGGLTKRIRVGQTFRVAELKRRREGLENLNDVKLEETRSFEKKCDCQRVPARI